MSEPTEGGRDPEPAEPQEGRREQPTVYDAEYVARLRREAARYRTEAKANAEAARRLAEIEEAQKVEAEKVAERLAKAERAVAEAEARALRRETALEYRLSAEDALLLDAVVDEEAMRALAKRLAQGKADTAARDGAYVPSEGRNTTAPALNSDQLEQALRAKLGIA